MLRLCYFMPLTKLVVTSYLSVQAMGIKIGGGEVTSIFQNVQALKRCTHIKTPRKYESTLHSILSTITLISPITYRIRMTIYRNRSFAVDSLN